MFGVKAPAGASIPSVAQAENKIRGRELEFIGNVNMLSAKAIRQDRNKTRRIEK